MATQQGINEMTGSIGNLTYFKKAKGYGVRKKSSMNKQKILTDPRMAGTRQAMSEFGSAGKSAKLFRNAIRPLLIAAKDRYTISRLLKAMRTVVSTDATNERGNRIVAKGAVDLLKGFNFNNDAVLESSFFAPYSTSINRAAETLKIDIPAFQPNIVLPKPSGATHFKIFTSSCEIDFQKETFNVDHQQTAPLPCDNNLTAAISQLHNATPGSTLPLFLMMGIQFYTLVNGVMYPVLDKTHNPLAIVAVDKP